MTQITKRDDVLSWDPFRELDDFSNRLSRVFGRPDVRTAPMADWTPRANIHESTESYDIQAELPQVKKEDVSVTFENGVLTLSGERKYEKKEGGGQKPLRVESAYGSFVRSFAMPDDADPDKVDARYENGMLNIKIARVPSKKAAAAKTITVK
jgi:HSP20 family protein